MKAFLFCLLLPFSFYGQDLQDGLLLHYMLDGTAEDQSPNNFDGTASSIIYVEDRLGIPEGAAQFNGVNSYIDLPNNVLLKPELPVSFSFWVKLSDLEAVNNIFVSTDFAPNEHSGVWMNLSSSGFMAINYGDVTGGSSPSRRTKVGTTALETDVWYHVVGIANGPFDMEIYINCNNDNGSYNGSGGSLTYTDIPGTLGRKDANPSLPPNYFTGILDDLRYYDRALTQEEALLLCSTPELGINILVSTPPSCKNFTDGIIEVEGIGGIPPYEYSINGGDFADINVFDGLDVGIFDIVVRDSQGDEIFTSVILESSDEFEIEVIDITESACADIPNGSLEVQALDSSGSSAGFTYSLDGISFQESGLFENLVASLYTVIAQNADGCIQEINFSIDQLDGPPMTSISTDPSCVDAEDGSIQIAEGSDLLGVIYNLGNVVSADGLFTNLSNGEYEITATGLNGCQSRVVVVLDSSEECEDEVLCPLLQNRLGMQINKWGDDRYSLRFHYRDQVDHLESCEYDELFEMIYFHLVTKSSNIITTPNLFEIYCQDMDKLSAGDFTPLVEKLQDTDPDYSIVDRIELIRSFVLSIGDGECIKI